MAYLSLFILFFLFLSPQTAVEGSCYGITLWSTQLLPSLLPCFILTKLIRQACPSLADKPCYLLMGTLCGYPVGASLVHPGDPFTKKSLFLSWFYQYGQSKFHHSFLWHSFFESIRHGFPFLIFTSDNRFFFGKPYILSPFSTKRQGTSCSLLPKSHNFPVFERYHFR